MKYYVDECCGCSTPSYPCLGSACPNRNVPYWQCDACKADELNEDDMYNDDICNECAVKFGYIDEPKIWKITGVGLPPFYIPSNSFDEALELARKVNNGYNSGQIAVEDDLI